ncbi:hypothetical protein X975_17021, partial [Stegodyphus mimosarum]
MVKVIGQGTDRYAVVCFKKPEDVDKALEVSKDKLFFGCKIEVTAHEGLDAEDNEFRPLEAELDEFHPKATRTLFIGNLEKDITTAELRKHFEQFGEIIEIDIKKQGAQTSYAFIQYSDIASVVKAMRKLDGENLGANRIKLGFGKSMPTNCVWLDGIVDTVSDKFLARHFSRFGIVVYTAVDREKGHALIFYESVEFAQIAVSEMRGRILQGKKLQVDFASRECQTTFFEKLEMTGQLIPGDGARPWERRERRGPEFEVVRNDDREARVGFDNRVYPRYEGQPRPNRGNFRGGQRAGFSSRGRGQGFSARYEVYHDEFGERRHRYSREDSGSEATMFDGKIERGKYVETADCPNRKRNKLRNSISDQESHHSQSPPRSRHQSRSTSPVSKDRKSLKDRLHHRIKSPGSHNSSVVNSPCRDTISDETDINSDYKDSRPKSLDIKQDDAMTDISYTSPRSSSEKDGSEKLPSKIECDSVRSRSSIDAESADEAGITSEQLSQLERKKRLLASSRLKGGKELNLLVTKSLIDKAKLKITPSHNNTVKSAKINCVSDASIEEEKNDAENISIQQDCSKDKPHPNESANTDLKYLQKKQVHLLHLLEQLREGVNSSDNEGSVDGRIASKKHRSSSSCLDAETFSENDSGKSLTKDECGTKLCKSSIKDPAIFTKVKSKADSVENNNCISLSLDSFIFRKHLDPRKNFDQRSVSVASVNSLQKCRRISMDNDTCLPHTQGANDSFLCVSSSLAPEVSWKKQCNSLNDVHFSENDADSSLSVPHFKIKEDNMEDDLLTAKKSLPNSSSLSLDLPKGFISLRSFPDNIPCHEIKRERDISPLSLPLPKFAASLRSPKSSPSILTSPKSTTAHSPRAGLSPSSYASTKTARIPDLLHDIQNEKKFKEIVPDEKVNGANISPADSVSHFESQIVNESSECASNLEPIQSPRSICEKMKESISSSESEFSPSSSPNRPSIEDRIKALDEKFNAWSGSTRTSSATMPDTVPAAVVDVPKCATKRSRFNFLTSEIRSEPSEIVKSLLARSTIFDQDSKRLQHIDEKYEPLNVKVDVSPKIKPAFRTKAAAKEFSTPIAPPIQNFSQPLLVKSPASVLVAQGIMSPPATPQSATGSILSPITPPVVQYTQLTPQVYTPCSPHATSFPLQSNTLKTIDNLPNSHDKDLNDSMYKPVQVFNSLKAKIEPGFHTNSSALATSLKSNPLPCAVEIPTHGMSVSSPPNIKKEPSSPTDNVTEIACKAEVENKVSIKKEMPILNSASIPSRKECALTLGKDHSHFNSIDHDKKEFCDSKDPRLAFHEGASQWRESACKDDKKVHVDNSAKSFVVAVSSSDISENSVTSAVKKRVSSIDSNESDSCKSLKLFESSRDGQENWSKHDKTSEPEAKKPKLSKTVRDRSGSPPIQQSVRKNEKKEKCSKNEKSKTSISKSNTVNNSEKTKHESKSNSKTEYKEKTKSDHKSKEEKHSKSHDSKDSSSKNDQRNKSRERRNSEKYTKSGHSSNPSNKPKKDSTANKNEKSSDKKQTEKKSRTKSSNHDIPASLEEEPVYFSMYDKVKARSSKSALVKQITDQDTVLRQSLNKLKQSRAKRGGKTKSIDQDRDSDIERESDNDSHSGESDSEAKPAKVKQPRKRKAAVLTDSDDELTQNDSNNKPNKTEKTFNSDSAVDSDFECNLPSRQSSVNKNRKKKSDVIDSDSSDDSDSPYTLKSQKNRRKKSQSRIKSHLEKSKRILKFDDETSDLDIPAKPKEKDSKPKKVKKEKVPEAKMELEVSECEVPKRIVEECRMSKKKCFKEVKQESDSSSQKKVKIDHAVKENTVSSKDRKIDSCAEKMQDSSEKHKPYSKKRKKSKKLSRNKEKRSSEKMAQDSSRKQDECDSKSSLPVLQPPKPSSPLPDKQLSPPCLHAGVLSDNDFKSDFSDFEFEPRQNNDMDSDLWKPDVKSDSEKSSKSKRKDSSVKVQMAVIPSPEQDSSLPSFFDKLEDITDSEAGREPTDCTSDVPCDIHLPFPKEKDAYMSSSPHKTKHEKHDDEICTKSEGNKYCDTYSNSSKEERRKKKSKKQCKERKKKVREDISSPLKKSISGSAPLSPPKAIIFENPPGDDDSQLSVLRLDEEIAEEARRLEQGLLAESEETSTFGDDGPAKREEKLLERRFEEEAAKETRRLEAELFSTGRDSWHMKEKEYDSEANSGEVGEDKHGSELDVIAGKEENIFAGLDIHSSIVESSQNDGDVFLSGHSESDHYKLDDKDVANEMEDQRKIEDDLAVSALLQEMHCGEISAPELTKETDYLDPLIETHPEETMNYLLPDDGENSLHIADSPVEAQGAEGPEEKLETSIMLLSPSSNSEPPSLEISNVEDSVLMKIENMNQACHTEALKLEPANDDVSRESKNIVCYEFQEETSLELCESKPPVIDIPAIPEPLEQVNETLSPKLEVTKIQKKNIKDKHFRTPLKNDNNQSNEDTDESGSELAENQLTHFEDITMDTTDSKDDDNPPILLPVESPRSHLPVTESKEKSEYQEKIATEENQNLDNIINKTPVSCESLNFDKVADLDKEIDDILDSITETKKQNLENDSFRIPDSHERCLLPVSVSNLSDQNSIDSIEINNSTMFENSKPESQIASDNISASGILKSLSQTDNVCNTNYSEEINHKLSCPETANKDALEPPVLSYSAALNSSCETNIIPPSEKPHDDNEAILISDKQTLEPFIENVNTGNIQEENQGSSDFLLELFGPKTEENDKTESETSAENLKNGSIYDFSLESKSSKTHDSDVCDFNSDSKHKNLDSDSSALEINLPSQITPLFEIPEVNEQNEATEFNQEIFEHPTDSVKEPKLPRLLTFSSEQLFSDSAASKAADNSDINTEDSCYKSENPHVEFKLDDGKSEQELTVASEDIDLGEKTVFPKSEDRSIDNLKEESLNIDDSLEKSKLGDAESVCSDTTDITVPETKIEPEISQPTLNEEQAQEELCPVENVVTVSKTKSERPRRGRRPKTRKYVKAAAQKQEAHHEVPVNPSQGRSTGRRVRPVSSERTRRSLRSDTSDSMAFKELYESKQNSVDEITQSENEEGKKDITEITIDDSTSTQKDSLIVSPHGENDAKVSAPQTVKNEEPRKRRGRKKKTSGDHQVPQLNEKSESRSEEPDISKDFNRPKESRLWQSLSSDKEQKSSKDNTSSAYDVFEFREEDEDLTFESGRLHDNARANTTSTDQKHESKVSEVSVEKEKKVEESKVKSLPSEDREHSKEHHAEVNQHKKISITIRLHQKDGHNGTSPGTAEVVKTSEALNIEEVKPEPPTKVEKSTSSKQEVSTPDIPYNGPCKSTRKSTRLMNQAMRSTVDEVIEEVVKGNFKASSNSHSEPVPTRVTRRSRSSRRSEESLSLVPSENSEDTSDDKNKNEPVFFILDNAVKDISDGKKNVSNHPSEITPSTTDVRNSESDKISDRTASLRSYRFNRGNSSKLEQSNRESMISPNSTAIEHESQKKDNSSNNSSEEKFDSLHPKDSKENKEGAKESRSTSENLAVYRPPLPVLKVEIPRMNLEGTKDLFPKPEKLPENEEDSNSRSSPAVLIDPVTGFLAPVDKSEPYSEASNTFSHTESKGTNNILVSDLSSVSSSILKSVSKPVPVVETSTVSSVIQDSSKSNQTTASEKSTVGRAPLVQSLRSRHLPGSSQNPVTVTTSLPSVSEPCMKLPISTEKTTENMKLRSKKPSSNVIGVLTLANSAVPSGASLTVVSGTPATVALTDSVSTNLASSVVSQAQSPVITAHGTVANSATTTAVLSHDKTETVENSVSKVSHPVHSNQSAVRAIVTAVVTPTSVGHSTSLPSNVQNKCSVAAVTSSVVLNKSELPVVYSTASIPPTSVTEHISSSSCKPIALIAPLSSEHSTIQTVKQELHSVSSVSMPTSSWSGSKVSTTRITDAHVSTIQTNATSNPIFTTKSETRSSKVSHAVKSNSAYTQQPAFPISSYEASVLSAAHGIGAASNNGGGVIAELLQNPRLLQQHKEYFAASSGQLQERIQSQMVRPTTPVASSIPPDIATRLGNPTPPHTPTPPVTSSNHSLPPSEIHPSHISSALHLRHPAQPAHMVPLGLHSDIAYVHQQMMYAHPYAAAIHSDLRAQ